MTQQPNTTARAARPGMDHLLALAAMLLVFLGSGLISYWNTRTLKENAAQVAATYSVITSLDGFLSLVKDAETGQRGYILTGNDIYLAPYSRALRRMDELAKEVGRLTADNPDQQQRLPELVDRLNAKMQELAETIELRRSQGFEAAKSVVVTDRGKQAMDAILDQINLMRDSERVRRSRRIEEMDEAYQVAVASGIITALGGVVLAVAVALLMRRAALARERQRWILAGEAGLSAAMVGDLRLEQLAENILTYLAEYLDAQAGAFFARFGDSYRRVATYGVPAANAVPSTFGLDDGLLARAAKDARPFFVRDVPPGYLTFGSALGQGTPRHLVVAPTLADTAVNAVFELGFIHPLNEGATELLTRVDEAVGVAVRAANDRTNLQNLLEETQRQAEELQAQGEALRVSNEELEEQGRILKESQARLEQQQAELEQTNTQLEEQTQLLAADRNDLARTKATLQTKARELESASQYKSDFLAKMSHELRTPLNSSLILAKLLADNPQGNLTEEQVRYAETIRAAGNDLLTLINDILDLSKIESGHVEIFAEPVDVAGLVEDLARTFQPVAGQKGLSFRTQVLPDCPGTLDTDRQRLEQVLKNLLSNALKFTESGEVALEVGKASDGRFSFQVRDTGIGIPEEQQEVIFEAFRQADSVTNRKYGGTGLGLSISRELTRLLGGELSLTSEPGRGSIFTVMLPAAFEQATVRPRVLPKMGEPQPEAAAPQLAPPDGPVVMPPGAGRIADDRDRMAGGRVLLVVEDDEAFARILYDLVHELKFQCLIATTAEEGMALARQHLPSAVVLDVGLPDHSGLSVLDRLKHDARTRHIPVHVISAGDHAPTALALGAVGYLNKPVGRETLARSLVELEQRLSHRVRRVLVVEDDQVQRESLQKLIGSPEVETIGAGSASECLDRLKGATFDCMVLDLTLPDASGYSLLETLSREHAYSFPPVIVYTGRDLSAEEEQQLGRYSRSIIIKGARSPERLLDEVTLFLHQVVSDLPAEQQKMLEKARSRDVALEGRRILVVEDDVRNIFALTSVLEPRGAEVHIARNGREALEALDRAQQADGKRIDLVLMDVMMPEMDGLTATREIRKRPEWKRLPVIMLTAKAMQDDQERCLAAGANDYMSKPLDVEKLLSLVRVWLPR